MIHPADVAGCGDEEKVLASGWPAPGFDITSGTADGGFSVSLARGCCSFAALFIVSTGPTGFREMQLGS